MMKEEAELESLVLSLATSIGLDIITAPQKGVRQHGVDIHAVGIDPEDGVQKNFLITIKQGYINRTIWNEGNQGVRSSLDEIIDVYIQTKLSIENKKLPSKIILCCGGELKAEATENWNGYTSKHTNLQFDLWNGSKLSSLIEDHLLDENIFIEDIKKKMRRTLVVLSDFGYDLSHYKEMLNDFLFGDEWKSRTENSLEKKAIKALSMIPVCLGMIHTYSKEVENSKHPLIAAEFTLLRTWDFIQKNNLEKNIKIFSIYNDIFSMYSNFGAEFFNKINPHTQIPDGITIHCRNSITASEVVFEQIGILSSLGLSQALWGIATKDEKNIENAKIISDTLKNVISNNGISGSPCFDEMTTDITLAVILLYINGEAEFIKDWFFNIVQRFSYSYCVLGKGFPIGYDSIETLVEFEKEKNHSKEEMSSTSMLLAMIGYWCAILDDKKLYPELVDFIETKLPHCTVQMWFPRKGIKDQIYKEYASNEFGIAEAPIHLPKSIEELRERLLKFIDFSAKSDSFETVWNDSPPALPLLASRHFRTPVIPFFWLNFVKGFSDEALK
ncbi:hypothetical protein [Bacteriovorax stolpii]|nr:hypothetical protein [Bacteriovorax stolpii]